MNKIRDWLYIGKYSETKNITLLQANGINAMLLLAEDIKQPGITSLYLPVEDGVELPFNLLKQGIEFVLNQRNNGKIVLVACGAGISRSASFAIAALKEAEHVSLKEATRQVALHHPQTLPHPELWKSLCEYYAENISLSDMFRLVKNPGILNS